MAKDFQRLALAARRLGGLGAGGKRLPPLLVFSDPHRLADLRPLARTGPPGLGLVLRGFGDPGALAQARDLARISRARRHVLLVGADEALAKAAGAQGVHLPERLASRARVIRARHPLWVITIAAHSPAAAHRAARAGADAVVVSSIFPSQSPSAGAAIGPARLAMLRRQLGAPVYALGGVKGSSVQALARAGVSGAAVVGAARS